MCCLFGLIDTQLRFTGKQKSKLLHVLASASEVRGTDATGVAYGSGEILHIYKRPIPGHKLNFYIRDNSRFAMGHARMTTQGNASRNRNNHPFRGILQAGPFALAHNGVLYNDMTLRERLHLPKTRIETDSYIAVQLIEQKGVLSFDSLRYMAEQLRGSFTITVLDSADSLYIVKGDNPFCLYFYPSCGLYVYASTKEILEAALEKSWLSCLQAERVDLSCGDILRIDSRGQVSKQWFDSSNLLDYWYGSPWLCRSYLPRKAEKAASQAPYLENLKSVAPSFGYTPEAIDRLFASGMEPEEIEEFLYFGGYGEL